MKNFLLIICAAILIAGCGNQIQTVPPLPGTLPIILSAEKIDTDIYFDATVSMKGFTTLAAGNVYLTLPDLLGDLGGAMGVRGYRLTKAAELDDDLVEILFSKGAAVIDVYVPEEENVLPMVPGGKSLDQMVLGGN